MVSAPGVPLPVLLSRALGHLTAEVEPEVEGPPLPSLPLWSNVVRCVGEADGLDERDLPAAARLSSRMATAVIGPAQRGGWITAKGTAKKRRLLLTDAGCAAFDFWPIRLKALDKRWKKSGLREPLEKLVGQLELELPHFPASYGAADPSAVGGSFVRSKEPGGLAHGRDWKPVIRREGDTVASLPLTALLSQALMAFTIDYENGLPWPLHSTLTTLVHIESEPSPLDELPSRRGVSGNGKSLLERHLIVEVTRNARGREVVALTDRGRQVRERHPARLETVESEWRDRYGDELIGGLRKSLTPLATGAAANRPDHLMMARSHVG